MICVFVRIFLNAVVIVVFVRAKELTIVEVFHFFINKGNEFNSEIFLFYFSIFLIFSKLRTGYK